jgi:hypothetical protein
MKPEWMLKINEEVVKQLEIEWTNWVANIVLVSKKDGCVRMCLDFRDLNKASLKNDFPLSHIDLMVDNMVGSA